MRRGSHHRAMRNRYCATEDCEPCQAGNRSSIKQKPSCAADLPILSPKCGKAAGCVFELPVCGLVGAERFSIETTLDRSDMPSLRLGQILVGIKSSSRWSKLLLRLV